MRPEQKEHFLFFHAVGNFIIPTDELIFSEGWLNHQPVMTSMMNIWGFLKSWGWSSSPLWDERTTINIYNWI
jgi:hypothetical protein